MVLIAGFALFTDRVVLHPQVDAAAPADAIVVLGGYGDDPLALGLALRDQGVAPRLVVSDPYRRDDNLTTRTCADPPAGTTCFAPEPSRTIGEAEELRRLGDAEGWARVVVVTGTEHVSRARYIVGQCWDRDIAVVAPAGAPSGLAAVGESVYQAAGFARAFLEGGC